MYRHLVIAIIMIVVASCQPIPVKNPPSTAHYPSSNLNNSFAPPQAAQISGSQRLQYAWSKAIDGVAMGGMMGGPYGAGGGLIIGLIAGLIMADDHFEAIHGQIQTEYQKHRELEAAIEQELARQRDSEKQIVDVASAGAQKKVARSSIPPKSEVGSQVQSPSPQNASTANRPEVQNTRLASLAKPAESQLRNVKIRDINGDGVPDIWIYYNPQKPDEIMRQEESSKGDGRVDTWSYFNDARLVRREVDRSGQGRPDTIFYYVNDKIAREERDENGHGRMTYRATFENGRLAKVEKETRGKSRTDLWIYYDTARDGEIVVKQEEDLDGDGNVDLWSYYNNGRLVRRDVSVVGLELLSRQEKLPVLNTDLGSLLPAGG